MRSAPARLRLRIADRLIFVWLYQLFPSLLGAAVIFQPETLRLRRSRRINNRGARRALAKCGGLTVFLITPIPIRPQR
jgi:hypothetical protein